MIKKKVFLLSFISGGLLCLPWLFPNLGWSLFVALVPLLLSDNLLGKDKGTQNNHFFYYAFAAFLVWNLGSTWWIAHVSFSGMLVIVLLNSLMMALVWWAGNKIRRQFGEMSGFFALLVFWLAFEFLHHNWTLQWPWLTLGNGLANSVKIIQWYEFTGVLGGSLWILISNFLIFLLVKQILQKSFKNAAKLTFYTLLLIGLPIGLSFYIYSGSIEKGSVLEIVLLQPNIDPYTEKFSGMNEQDQVKKLVSLAGSVVSESTDLVVAPETAFPPMWEDSILQYRSILSFREMIRKFPELSVFGGSITKRKFGLDEPVSETGSRSTDGRFSYDTFNSALLFDRTEKIQIGHKRILVSGVEKMPFQKYFSFLKKFIVDIGGTSGGLASANESTVFTTENGLIVGPVICFESAFGAHCSDLAKKGAELLVVITNDGWWKESPGSWQHFGYSRIRAIETRRFVARSANTGISGFINQRGDVLKKSGLNTCDVISAPIRLNDGITFYVRNGDFIGRICSLLSALILMYFLVKRLNWF
jgi:apolipoprotein N-acyltransferase